MLYTHWNVCVYMIVMTFKCAYLHTLSLSASSSPLFVCVLLSSLLCVKLVEIPSIHPVTGLLQGALGVKKSKSALLYVVTCPVGPYFSSGLFSPVSLYANPKFVRSWIGGTGDAKIGG